MGKITRRDFLRLVWGLSSTTILAKIFPGTSRLKSEKQLPNFIILVCDAMTARNLSLYGYSRKTTPNLERLAERALVYHRHYSNGNYTTPGTSSLLTGLRPWTHRAINGSGIIKRQLSFHNIFHFLGKDYFRMAYTQNYWADYLLDQLSSDIDSLLPLASFDVIGQGAIDQSFRNDSVVARHSIERMIYFSNSLLLSFITSLYYQNQVKRIPANDHPFGLPSGNYFPHRYTLEGLFEGITNKVLEMETEAAPFFAYFHIFPPHWPYRPRQEFFDLFYQDGYRPVVKPEHRLSHDSSQAKLNDYRNQYDGYLANIDAEIGKLIATLEKQGVLDHTYFIITSDHGESFERGMSGHFTPLLYETLIRIPLIIIAPGNQSRKDCFTLTNSIDILPTILTIAGKEIPSSCEGSLLPRLGGSDDPKRSIITMDAKENPAFKPLKRATFALIRGNYKLIYYLGYGGMYQDYYEFYNLEEDPEELQDLKAMTNYETVFYEMKQELLAAIEAANQQYS